MSEDHAQSGTVGSERAALTGWAGLVPVVFRAVAALLLAPSAVLKLVAHSKRAAVFADLGVPAPEVTVVVVGLLELLAAVLIATGTEGRVGALVGVPIMIAAIGFAGLMVTNIAVLVACVGIVGLGPGRYTLRDPERDLLQRVGETIY